MVAYEHFTRDVAGWHVHRKSSHGYVYTNDCLWMDSWIVLKWPRLFSITSWMTLLGMLRLLLAWFPTLLYIPIRIRRQIRHQEWWHIFRLIVSKTKKKPLTKGIGHRHWLSTAVHKMDLGLLCSRLQHDTLDIRPSSSSSSLWNRTFL
jgi:hypothetical protein